MVREYPPRNSGWLVGKLQETRKPARSSPLVTGMASSSASFTSSGMARNRQTSVPAAIKGLLASISALAIFSLAAVSARTDIGIAKVPGRKISASTSLSLNRSRGIIRKQGPPGGVDESLKAFMVHSGILVAASTFQRHLVNCLTG